MNVLPPSLARSRLALWCLGALLAGCATPPAPHRSPASWTVTNLAGQSQHIVAFPNDHAVVFEFLSVECPISNRVEPELERLQQQYTPLGVRFVPVYPNPGDTPDLILQHRAEAKLTGPAFRDPQQRLADSLQVTVTPEVVVLSPTGELIYRGRVNDQYAALGQGRPAPTRHDLAEALDRWLAPSPKPTPTTPPVGCRIQRNP